VSDDNKAVVRRFFDEAVNEGRVDVVDDLFSPRFSWQMPFSPETQHGPEGMKEIVTSLREAISDFDVRVDELIAEGDRVVAVVTASGTQDGELMGRPASNKRAAWTSFMSTRSATARSPKASPSRTEWT
jgi:ketosteroid isomerase-like protein